MKSRIFPSVLLLATGFAVTATAQTPVFTENFGELAAGIDVTTANTSFTYVRTAGAAPYAGALTTQNSSFGPGSSLRLLSSGYGSTPNFTGVGANGLASSSVYTLSLNLSSNLWQTGTSTYIMMGDWNQSSTNQVYNPGSTLTVNGMQHSTMGAQSLFAIRIVGSTALSGGYLQTIAADGNLSSIMDSSSTSVVLANGVGYNLRVIANGSGSAIDVAGNTIAAGTMGIYIDNVFVGSAAIADSVDATAFRIFSAGNSTGNLQNAIEIGDINIWNSAVAPIPESSTYGLFLGVFALAALGLLRRRKVSK